MRAFVLLSAIFYLTGYSATAQTPSDPLRSINISMTATELVPADQIIFNVNINAENRTPEAAFKKHQEMEGQLAELIKEMGLSEDNIRFHPVRISKSYRNNREDQYSQTNQQVSLTFSDFDLYEELQITLIENGFDSFNASFSSSELETGKEKALLLAIEAAHKKAAIIAEASGVELGPVKTISYGDYTLAPSYRMEADMGRTMSASSMMEFAQTVSVSANISIEYYIR